jgi:hypothetical protein
MADVQRQPKVRASRRGKILKVRLGYNANSSSLSAIVSLVMLGSAAAATVVGMISAILFTKTDNHGGVKAAHGK